MKRKSLIGRLVSDALTNGAKRNERSREIEVMLASIDVPVNKATYPVDELTLSIGKADFFADGMPATEPHGPTESLTCEKIIEIANELRAIKERQYSDFVCQLDKFGLSSAQRRMAINTYREKHDLGSDANKIMLALTPY